MHTHYTDSYFNWSNFSFLVGASIHNTSSWSNINIILKLKEERMIFLKGKK